MLTTNILLLCWYSLCQEKNTAFRKTQEKGRKYPVLIQVSNEPIFLFYIHCKTQPQPQFNQTELALQEEKAPQKF